MSRAGDTAEAWASRPPGTPSTRAQVGRGASGCGWGLSSHHRGMAAGCLAGGRPDPPVWPLWLHTGPQGRRSGGSPTFCSIPSGPYGAPPAFHVASFCAPAPFSPAADGACPTDTVADTVAATQPGRSLPLGLPGSPSPGPGGSGRAAGSLCSDPHPPRGTPSTVL